MSRKLIIIGLLCGLVGFASTSQFNVTTQIQGILPKVNGGTGNSTGQSTDSYVVGQLASDVTMTTANTFYDGPSVALTAGTWELQGSVDLQTTSIATAVNFTCKVWDKTTVKGAGYFLGPVTTSAAVKNEQMSITGIAVPTGAATWYISCTSTTASQIIKAAPGSNSPGNFASTLIATRIQ
jgi:hypothetical protein